ncbi:MAG: hypothetical protein KTR14_03235, partial [Vampirovibrio sp.]|nr:hypothetical protein [Vampirovibrio sp.]
LALQGANAQLGNINYSTIAGTMDNFPSPAEFEKKLSQFKAVIGSELGLTPEAANELAADAWLDSEVGIPVISS